MSKPERFPLRQAKLRRWIVLLGVAAGALEAHSPLIDLRPRYLNFIAAPGGPNPASQQVTLANATHGRMAWFTVVATSSGGNWLRISPDRGTLSGLVEFESVALTISVTSNTLAAGAYYGTIHIHAPGDSESPPADNTPQVVEVALTVTTSGQAAPGIQLAPNAVTFEATAGGDQGPSATISLQNAGGGSLQWTAAAETDSGGSWLVVSPGSGTNRAFLVIAVRPALLARGEYRGRVRVSAVDAANSPQFVQVAVHVRDPAPSRIGLSPLSLTFSGRVGTPNPAPQALQIFNAGEGAFNWRAETATFSGGLWLTATPVSGSGSVAITVAADLGNLTPGTYEGRVTITATGAVNSPAQIPVLLMIRRQQPAVTSNALVNAASFLPTPLAPGQLASLFGGRLGPRDGVVASLDPDTRKLPVTLGGTSLTFDGVPAPLLFVSEGQINFQVPFEVALQESPRLIVNVEGLDPAELRVPVGAAAPAVFTLDGIRAAALNLDLTLNTPANPAPAGGAIQLFMTGQGLLDRGVETGALAPTEPPFPIPRLSVVARIGAIDARVLFAGLAPGFAGVMQVNLEIPRIVPPSPNVPISISVGTETTPVVVLIAVN